MCEKIQLQQLDTLQQIERLLLAQTTHPDEEDQSVLISSVNPYMVDYKGHKHVYLLSQVTAVLVSEDLVALTALANTWTDISLQQGSRLTYADGGTTGAKFTVRATDTRLVTAQQSGPMVGLAAGAYPSNPTQTAAGAADTQYKWGANGLRQVQHVVLQNNTGSNISYAFDQSTATGTNQIYTLATGNTIFWDRAVSILHFASAAQQSFGGSSGITVEGFI